MAQAGDDFILALVLTDDLGNEIAFTEALSLNVTFTNHCNDVLIKSLSDGITLGATSTTFNVEVQDSESEILGEGFISVVGKVTVVDSRFSDNEATSVFELQLELE